METLDFGGSGRRGRGQCTWWALPAAIICTGSVLEGSCPGGIWFEWDQSGYQAGAGSAMVSTCEILSKARV